MILELAAIALTTKALVGILCGTVAGGLALGGAAGYALKKNLDKRRTTKQLTYDQLSTQAASRENQRQRSLHLTTERIEQWSEKTVQSIANNQSRASRVIEKLEQNAHCIEKNNESSQDSLEERQNEKAIIADLMAQLQEKTQALEQITGDYEEVKHQLNTAVTKLQAALTEIQTIKQTLQETAGEKDYIAQLLERIGRMKSTNSQLNLSLSTYKEKYKEAEQRIELLKGNLETATTQIKEQEQIIVHLRDEVDEKTKASPQSASSSPFTFF